MATYTVKPNDNLSTIASKQGITVRELKEANPQVLPPEYKLEIDQQINIPASADINNTPAAQTENKSEQKKKHNNNQTNNANNAAKANFSEKTNGQTQCPNQKEWITVVPLRYGVQQKHADSFKPEDLKISGLKTLKKHVYVPRPLMPGFVYLYSQKRDYILEAEYGENGTAKSASCSAGNAPSKAISGSSLQAEKNDTIELAYSPCKLPSTLITAFLENKHLRKKYFQTVEVKAARGKGTSNASPLCKLPKFLTDCKVQSNIFDWSIQNIESGITNSLLAAANAASPDNHIAVVLPDPITITTELALLFDAQYDVAMTSIAQTQHPYTVGKTTEQLLNKLTQSDYDRNVMGYTVKTVRHNQPAPGQIHNPHNVSLSYPLMPVYGYDTHVIPRTEKEIKALKNQNRNRAKKDYTEQLNYDRMQDFLKTRDDFTRDLGKTLDDEASDWLKWLDSKELNRALSFFTASAEPILDHLEKLEAALSNMTLNLQISSKGAALRDSWVDGFLVNLGHDGQFKEQEGASWYILLMIAGKTFEQANKVNKELIDASNIEYNGLSRAYTDFFSTGAVKATLATDQLNIVFGERLAQLGVHAKAEAAFFCIMERQSWRYGYNLHTVQHKMGEMLNDMHIHRQSAFNQNLGTKPTAIAAAIKTNTLINTFNLAEPAPSGRIEKAVTPFAKWFVNQADKAGFVKNDSLPVQAVHKAGKSFERFAGKGLGVLFLGQVYNFHAAAQKLFSEEYSTKNLTNAAASLAGLVQTSLSLVQRTMFEGSEAAMKTAAKVKLQTLGVKTSATFKHMHYILFNGEHVSLKTSTLTSKTNRLVQIGRTGYKMLPVIGNLLAVVSSGFNIHRDFNKDEGLLTKSVGIASGAVNTLALGCAIVALVSPAAPLIAVTGIVLAIAGIALDLWHSYLQASDMELFLKGSFWGKDSDYKFKNSLNDIASRLEYYENLNDSEVQNAAEKELHAFCHQLYKPILTVDNYSETDYGEYENFTLNIHLPGFDPSQGQAPYFKLTAMHAGNKITLFESGQHSQIPATHQINNPLANNTLFTQSFELNETKRQMDFDDYQLELKHHQPVGFPVTLHYKIDINDDSKIPLFTKDVSFDIKRVGA